MLEYSIQILSLPLKHIMEKAAQEPKVENFSELYQARSKSSSDSSSGGKGRSKAAGAEKKSHSQNKYGLPEDGKHQREQKEVSGSQQRVEVFCAGNNELQKHASYLNLVLLEQTS